jgi:hypothetical protein
MGCRAELRCWRRDVRLEGVARTRVVGVIAPRREGRPRGVSVAPAISVWNPRESSEAEWPEAAGAAVVPVG